MSVQIGDHEDSKVTCGNADPGHSSSICQAARTEYPVNDLAKTSRLTQQSVALLLRFGIGVFAVAEQSPSRDTGHDPRRTSTGT
jgi:hypothetical protein